jgi:hypothetical protein
MRIAGLLVLGLFLVSVSADVHAEEWPTGPERRVLGEHRFQPVLGIQDPFVTTHLATVTGGGLATGLEAALRSAAGDTIGTLDGDLAFFRLDLAYQLNLFGRGSIALTVSGTGRAGIDDQALLADGLTTVYGIAVDVKYALWRDDLTQLSAVARLSRKNLFGIDPFGFAQRVLEAGELTEDNGLVKEGDINRGALGAAIAHGWRPWLGLTGFLVGGSAQPVLDGDDREWFTQVGVAASFDLNPLKGFPLGFALAYDFDSFPEGGSDVARGIHSGTISVNYTGREDFHCGVEVSVATLKQTDIDNTLAASTFVLSLRYFF